jgi:hypothetical protein
LAASLAGEFGGNLSICLSEESEEGLGRTALGSWKLEGISQISFFAQKEAFPVIL